MNKIIALLLLAFVPVLSFGQETDFTKELNAIKAKQESLTSSLSKTQNEVTVLTNKLSAANSEIDSLRKELAEVSNGVTTAKEKLSNDISITNANVESQTKVLAKGQTMNLIYLVTGIVVLLVVIGVSVYLLRKRISSTEEESVKLDTKLLDVIEKQLNLQNQHVSTPTTNSSTTTDHSLALKVADEIVRIEMNLSKMDSSIKGYKQLSKAVTRIKDNFSSKGYEITEMLGQNYNEGMKVVANFVTDETLPEGAQIITGIIKPQILFNGTMIQSAQITVSQNI